MSFLQQKQSGWEGAVRCNAIFFAPFLQERGVVRNQLMHVTDLLPTLGRLAGIKFDVSIDGVDQWDVIKHGGRAVREEVVDFDDVLGYGSLIQYPFKLVNGTLSNGIYDGWLSSRSKQRPSDPISYAINVLNSTASRAISSLRGRSALNIDRILSLRADATVNCSNLTERNYCDLRDGPCVFDLHMDPCEENNLARENPLLLNALLTRFNEKLKQAVPSRRRSSDPACDPINFGLNWQWWR